MLKASSGREDRKSSLIFHNPFMDLTCRRDTNADTFSSIPQTRFSDLPFRWPLLAAEFNVEKGLNGISMHRILLLVGIGAALGLVVYCAPAFMVKEAPKVPAIHLHTGGTSTADLIIGNSWRTAYRMQKGIEVDYKSTGSTKGFDEMVNGDYPIVFVHAPITEEQKKKAQGKGGEIIQVPVVLCSVVPIYNLKELKKKPPLKFTGDVLADIFLGKITRWNHPDLKAINEGVDLPDTKITVVHREDSSGTTFLFTDYLAGTSPVWKEKMGNASSQVKWPVGVGMPRSFNVAHHVKVTEGAIGYADLVYSYFGDIQYGAVQNKDKTTLIHAKPENMTAAAKAQVSAIKEDLSFDLTNKPGKDSYPITGAIWAVCYQKQPAATRTEVHAFLSWITHEGQKLTSALFAPLPEEYIPRVEEKLKLLAGDK